MLKHYYESKRTIWRLNNCGLFGPHMEEFALYLSEKKLSRNVVRNYIRAAGHISRYALWEGKTDIFQLDSKFACRFINEHLPVCTCERMNSGAYSATISGLQHILDFLSFKGFISLPEEPVPDVPTPRHNNARWLPRKNSAAEKQREILVKLPDTAGGVLLRYDEYLDRLFGLCKKTRDIHRAKILIFLKWLYERHGNEFELDNLTAQDILTFQEMCNEGGYSDDYRKTVTGCLRGFLRFLKWERILEEDLTSAVFKVIEWKLASIPKYIPYDDAMLLLSAPDRTIVKGKRDYLMLLLMLQLGLRANEIVQLQLEDIHLQKGEVFIRKTKTSKERVLPLTNELAEAIVNYLQNRITESPQRHLLLRSVPPYEALQSSSVLGTMVKKYIAETGIKTPTFGTHQLRHSLATHLVNNGVSFKETADILGHQSIQTTGIYAKVLFERLKIVALPFPHWEKVCAK